MGAADKFVWACNSHDLRDDAWHVDTEALAAFALADTHIVGKDEARLEQISFGALLCRVKYADGVAHQMFEGGVNNLAGLLRIWKKEVQKKGQDRKWITVRNHRDVETAAALFNTVAELSLAQWLDGHCKPCGGTGVKERITCGACGGSGTAPIATNSEYVRNKVLDMVSELECIASSHAARAGKRLREQK